MQQFRASSYLFGGNAPFVEQLYEQWLENPQAVPAQWRDYFERLQLLPAHRVCSAYLSGLRTCALPGYGAAVSHPRRAHAAHDQGR